MSLKVSTFEIWLKTENGLQNVPFNLLTSEVREVVLELEQQFITSVMAARDMLYSNKLLAADYYIQASNRLEYKITIRRTQ